MAQCLITADRPPWAGTLLRVTALPPGLLAGVTLAGTYTGLPLVKYQSVILRLKVKRLKNVNNF